MFLFVPLRAPAAVMSSPTTPRSSSFGIFDGACDKRCGETPVRLRLGPHVLRAETAAIAGAAVLAARRTPLPDA